MSDRDSWWIDYVRPAPKIRRGRRPPARARGVGLSTPLRASDIAWDAEARIAA